MTTPIPVASHGFGLVRRGTPHRLILFGAPLLVLILEHFRTHSTNNHPSERLQNASLAKLMTCKTTSSAAQDLSADAPFAFSAPKDVPALGFCRRCR